MAKSMTADEIVAGLRGAVGSGWPRVSIGTDVHGRVVVADPGGAWDARIRPGTLPLDADGEGTPPVDDPAFRELWAAVDRLTGGDPEDAHDA